MNRRPNANANPANLNGNGNPKNNRALEVDTGNANNPAPNNPALNNI